MNKIEKQVFSQRQPKTSYTGCLWVSLMMVLFWTGIIGGTVLLCRSCDHKKSEKTTVKTAQIQNKSVNLANVADYMQMKMR